MDTAQWPQEMVVKPMEEIVTKPSSSLERKIKPQRDQVVNCPRCNSTNTKFCYYNNYSLSQPRYFCKTCRRYWTAGGSLRNIPVGGGSRKNKRSSSTTTSSSNYSSSKKVNLVISQPPPQNPNKIIHEGQDLNLDFPPSHHDFKTFTELIQVPNYDPHNTNNNNKENNQLSAMELLTGISAIDRTVSQRSESSSRTALMGEGLNSFMPISSMVDPNAIYSSGFSLSEPKQSLNFSLDGLGSNGFSLGGLQSVQETSNGRLFFPFEDLKQQVSNTTTNVTDDAQQNIDQNADSTGYWNGVLGGGTW